MTGSRLKLIACLMLISTLPMLPGCVGSGNDVWCQTNDPVRPTAAEYAGMDRQSKQRMRTHNAYGVKLCGWKATA